MKSLKYLLLALPLALLGACSADEGSEPGTNPVPTVTLFHYTPDAEKGLNPDNDVTVRFATNSATTAVYYKVDLEEDMKAYISSNGTAAYMQKIIEEGEKIEVNGADNIDKDVTGIKGACVLVAVATNGGSHSMDSFSFFGLDWTSIVPGYIQYNIQGLPHGQNCELQKCTNVEDLYRIKDAFPAGMSMKFTVTDKKGTNENGNFTLVRVPENESPWSTSSGPVYVGDIATWKADDNLAFTQYPSFMYEDYFCEFALAWYVSPTAYVGMNYAYFVPQE